MARGDGAKAEGEIVPASPAGAFSEGGVASVLQCSRRFEFRVVDSSWYTAWVECSLTRRMFFGGAVKMVRKGSSCVPAACAVARKAREGSLRSRPLRFFGFRDVFLSGTRCVGCSVWAGHRPLVIEAVANSKGWEGITARFGETHVAGGPGAQLRMGPVAVSAGFR